MLPVHHLSQLGGPRVLGTDVGGSVYSGDGFTVRPAGKPYERHSGKGIRGCVELTFTPGEGDPGAAWKSPAALLLLAF